MDKDGLYNLGRVLGLSFKRVKDMKDSSTFCDDLVNAWLSKVDDVIEKGLPTWRNLVKALRDHKVGQIRLAEKIAKEKCVC